MESDRDICFIPETKKERVILELQENFSGYREKPLVHRLFELQVERSPDAVAVVWEDKQLTYRKLNDKADRLASYLQGLGVGPEVFVGIYLERSIFSIVALLAILKAGGVYLPIDPAYPQERLTFMLQDSQAKLILTQDCLIANLQTDKIKVVNFDRDWYEIEKQAEYNPQSSIAGNNLAYVIYTSGSTGLPKGVLIEHEAIANHCQNIVAHYQLTENDRVLQFASVGFDVSLEQILPTLIVGATVVLAETKFLTGLDFHAKLQYLGLTVVNLPPAYWTQWLQSLESNSAITPLDRLRLVICGGEAMSPHTLKLWQKSPMKAVRLLNAYGPTETTITAMTFEVPQGSSFDRIPIGRPLNNREVYILDSERELVSMGSPGELYIGGESLARGYLNQSQLTAEKFISNPHVEKFHGTSLLYKTGDLARYLPDGNIEFLGRIDNQVKIRGFRLELGEIEAFLNQHPDVSEAVVILREDIPNDKRLVAYIIPSYPIVEKGENTLPLLPTAYCLLPPNNPIRSFLAQKLPEYMIPSAFVVLDKFPLNTNGKIDRRAFPIPNLDRDRENLILPRNSQEEILVSIWTEVLKVNSVSIDDNFFEIGGHSLLAMQVISRIREAFGVEIPLISIFEAPTIAEFAAKLDRINSVSHIPSIEPRKQSENIPLSFPQEGLWFLNRLQGNAATYNISTVLRLAGKLDFWALEQAFTTIVERHEVLRTNFIDNNGSPIQIITDRYLNFSLPSIDLQNLPEAEQKEEIEKLIRENSRYSFDLAAESLLKTCLLCLNEESHLLLLTVHHIIADGWSMGILVKELSILYQAFSQGKVNPLEALPIQYADFAIWQKKWFSGSRLSFALSNKLTERVKKLSQESGVTVYMTLLAILAVLLSRYSRQLDIPIGSAIANRNQREIESLIGFFVNTLVLRVKFQENPSFSDLLKQVRQVALEAYTHRNLPFEKLVEELQPQRSLSFHPLFQVMFVWQNTPQTQWKMPGLTITEEPVDSGTAKFDLTLSLEEKDEIIQGYWEYNTDLFETETIKRMMGHFQTLLESAVDLPETRVSQLPILTKTEKHQLLVEWNQTQTDYPRDKCIHQLFEEQVAKTPDAIALVWQDIQLTYQELNRRSNQLANYLKSLGVTAEVLVGIFLDRSIDTIVAILAILKAGGAYLPLDPVYPSERLAFILDDGQVSLVLTQKSLVDKLPSNGECKGKVSSPLHKQIGIICLDSDRESIDRESKENLSSSTNADNLAYVMYTSGSTGVPKGVCIPHRGVVRLVKDTNYANFTSEAVFLQLASIAFDASTWEIWGSVLNGAKLVLFPGNKPSLAEIGQIIRQHRITTLWLTAGLFHLMVDERLEDLKPLRQLLAGGDVLSLPHVRKVLANLDNCQLINGYGPTENTTFTCCYSFNKNDLDTVSIGRPISNTQVYILDSQQQPVPIGVPGELYIGGDGLARGYLNRPDLTEEKFIPNPFKLTSPPTLSPIRRGDKGERFNPKLYKTGDLARYLPNGNIEFLGRIDNQVKIRGFRLELGEIETFLNQHPDVKEAVVIVREDIPNDKRLVAYIVPSSIQNPKPPRTERSEEQRKIQNPIRSFLAQKLPEYMIPSAFVVLDEFPLNSNGKIDRRSLPIPQLDIDRANFVAPRNSNEQTLANIWQEVLKVDSVSIYDNFFEIGGHSLLATQVISRISEAFGVQIPLISIFEAPSIAEFALKLAKNSNNYEISTIKSVSRPQKLPLSFAQQRLWFLDRLQPNSTAYNMPYGFRLKGLLNLEALEKSFRTIIQRYEILRTIFITVDGEPNQVILPEFEFNLSQSSSDLTPPAPLPYEGRGELDSPRLVGEGLGERSTDSPRLVEEGLGERSTKIYYTFPLIDLQHLPSIQREAEAEKIVTEEAKYIFSLQQWPLFRVKLLRLDDREYILLLNLHHIIFDGWSSQILFSELTNLYQAFASDRSPNLPELEIQYADFAIWQREWLSGEILASQLNYWKQQLSGDLPLLQLPFDRPHSPIQTYQATTYSCILPPALAENLKTLSHREGVTLFMILLTAFKVLLYRYSGQEDIIIGTPIAGRNRKEIERLIGFFVNSLVLRTDLSGNPSFSELLQRVKEVTLGAYSHQDLPFEKLVEELQPERDLNRTPIFQVWFNMVNLAESKLELTDIEVQPIENDAIESKFDISIYIREKDDRINLNLVYNTVLFNADTIEGMARHFQHLLEGIIAAPERAISTFPLLTETERKQLASRKNSIPQGSRQGERAPAPLLAIEPSNPFNEFIKSEIQQSIPARFQQQVKKYPNHLAVQTQNYQWTYQELENKSNLIAQQIINYIPSNEARIALLFEHDAPAIAAILAVLKLGKAYVPLDPNYPKDRVVYILENSLASIVLTNDFNLSKAEELTEGKLPIVNIDRLEITNTVSKINLDLSPDNIAYTLYTSGSTGQPKGVIQTHKNVLHFIRNYTNNLHIAPADKLTWFSSYSFDAAVIDIFSALLNGATLCAFDIKQEGLLKLSQWLQEYQITIYHSTPTVYRYFLNDLTEKNNLKTIRLVVLGGEEVVKKDVELYRENFGDDCIFVNGLGSTESSFNLQYLINKQTEIPRNSVPVGYPFDDTEILLLDSNGKPTDILGEIAIRSPHIALGYWGKNELTTKAFLPDPEGSDRRIYRTGDWGRLRADGSLEFLGRKDFQVKIRGFRIELSEIEAILNQHPDVKESVVVARENNFGEKYLIAYIVPSSIQNLKPPRMERSEEQRKIQNPIRSFLAQKLPDYMIPSDFIFLEKLPLTPNGKIDRRALPEIDRSIQETKNSFVQPRNELELKLNQIWQKVLGIESIGIYDDFFALGGNSLLLVRLLAEIEKIFDSSITLKALFGFSTIAELANILSQEKTENLTQILDYSPDENLPQLSANEQRWLLASTITKKRVLSKSSLIMLEQEGDKNSQPLFFVSPLGELSKSFDEAQTLYNLTVWTKVEHPDTFIQALAAHYVQEILAIQPSGPYFLGGYCFGGWVALEIAQQLQALGKEVGLLSLIQTPSSDPIYTRYQSLLLRYGYRFVLRLIGCLPALQSKQKLTFLWQKIQKLWSAKTNYTQTKNHKEENNIQPQIGNHSEMEILQSLRQARKNYIPKPYSGKVALFFAREGELHSFLFPKGGLGKILTGQVSTDLIPGNHTSILKAPNVRILTEKLALPTFCGTY
jgi:amino acid adenylation domain-containing protein